MREAHVLEKCIQHPYIFGFYAPFGMFVFAVLGMEPRACAFKVSAVPLSHIPALTQHFGRSKTQERYPSISS